MFSRDLKDFQSHTPRTLQSSKFGPYSRLSVPTARRRFTALFWMLAYGIGLGVAWWLLVAIKAGA